MSSTVAAWSDSPYTGIAEGEVVFASGLRLRIREELDFAAGLIASYGYEVYRADERLYWYDDFPHPEDQSLASTFPHHKHVPPDLRSNRVPAPGFSFEQPNLPLVLKEIKELA
ncbi:MAG: toxin-antitoxin system TumE family protein [Thermoanaerobaculia bacterium]